MVVLQLSIIPFISIGAVVPNILIILLVYFTLQYGQIYGTILGAVLGILFDLVTGGFLGSTMFSFTISGFIAGYFYNENKREFYISTYFFLVIVFISATTNSLLQLLLNTSEIKLAVASLILEQSILPAIYTAIFGLPVLFYNQRKRAI